MLTLIDGNSLLFRAYYGVRGNLTRRDGTPIGAVFGFMNMILPVLAVAKPDDTFICVFDASRISFRQSIYPQYKANRSETPADLVAQIELVRNAIRSTGMPVLCVNGVEADDVIATLAQKYCNTTNATRIITSDKDLMQLVSDCTFLYDGMKESEIHIPGVFEKFGVRPDQVTDVQSLMGDSSDNVPGVPGIGPKKAAELISEFGSLDNLYTNVGNVKNERIRNLLIENENLARVSKQLVVLKTDVDLGDFTPSPFIFNRDNALQFARQEIESPALANKIERLFPIDNANTAETKLQSTTTSAPCALHSNNSYKTITSAAELDEFLSRIKNIVAIDTETTGLNQMTDKLVGISLATDSQNGVYIPLRHKTIATDLFGGESVAPNQLPIDVVYAKLRPIFENQNITKIGHNLKYDLHIMANDGWDINAIAPVNDTILMSYILHGTAHAHNLDELAKIYLGHDTIKFDSLFPPRTEKQFANLDTEIATPYAAEDATIAFALYEIFQADLTRNEKLKKLYENCDLPLMPVLLNMERLGVLVDKNKLQHLSGIFHTQLSELEKKIFILAGHEFNIASPKQLATVLFDELGLQSNKKRSTDAGELAELLDAHEIIELILNWRSIAKLAGTYADALPHQIATDGRIHTNYLQISTNTGRLSSREPNLQNIPIKTELGAEIRKCFVAVPGRVLISVDYSQIQLRLLAHVANVKTFRETFNQNRDIHEQTARRIFNIADDMPVPKDLRRAAKTVNFSIIYGISSFGLAAQLNVSRTDAQKIIDSYMNGLPEVREWMERVREFAIANACVYTPWGRRIELPDIKNPRLRAYALRAAINAPIQGFEADLMRRTMVNIANKFANNEHIKMIMQVHDEIVFECDTDYATEYATIIETEMENVAQLSVPLAADYTIGTSWEK